MVQQAAVLLILLVNLKERIDGRKKIVSTTRRGKASRKTKGKEKDTTN
jgi:hypothetical protein